MPSRTRRRAGPPPQPSLPDSDASSEDEVSFKTARHDRSPAAADPQDDVSTLAGSGDEDEAPQTVGLADAREEAEALLRDLADSRRRRDDSRRQQESQRQERNRQQKLDKQRRMELELSRELMDELAEEMAEEEAAAGRAAAKKQTTANRPQKGKKKRFKYPTPAAGTALDFIPLTSGETTEFRAEALPESPLPSVVNPELLGLRERLLYSGRIPRTSSRGLRQIRHKQAVSGKYGRR